MPDTPDQPRFASLTTFRLGGPCRRLIDCATPAELEATLRALREPFLLVGGGSNLLVADEGLDVVAVRYLSPSPAIRPEGDTVVISGATLLDDAARWSAEEGRGGLVACSGIPGTVGGAVAGNAGAFGEQIGDRIVSAHLLDGSGRRREVGAEELGFAYRRSRLQETGEAVAEVRLRLSMGDAAALRARRAEILALRAAKHPDWRATPTAGSFFRNIEPTSRAGRRQAAGWYLEQAGALQMRVGGARTFARHANIIVADPGCVARDVLELSRRLAAAVRERFGLELQGEVRVLGFGEPVRPARPAA